MRRRALSQESVSGAVFVLIGVAAVALSSAYPLGTPAEMGPGFFPMALGLILIGLGATNVLRSMLAGEGLPIRIGSIRAVLLIPASALAFALLVERAGLALAVFVTIIIACLAAAKIRPLEALASAVVLAIFTSLLFVRLLDLPIQILPPS